ncbi:response regulator transcription factor [Neobacillus sp. MER 74]|uniref:response regulator transcription factor n=1 Tax=Neobacillus sp. MER 74 TaxID=2939566 RepID=UPI00203B43F5|nr:response regulator transcription factor [Neobacillus sp. MER 74]MCM3117491.1 response regulator transcription factor [Neobacillus sp. MER 74]
MNVLVCDDDKEIVDAIGIYLENEGYQLFKAFNGLEAINLIKDHEIHLIIMDIMMPMMDGLRATMKIREENNIPLIMLSAKSEDSDKILGLNLGADDYLTKPFNPLELIARVKSQLRRYTTLGSLETKQNVFRTGGLVIDDESKIITVDGEVVHLTPVQYKILKLLTANAGRVFSIEDIYERVWNETSFSPENTVSVHIRKIREKIEINPKEPKYLKVVWGVGYKVEKI